jgi:hypothetical protein
MAQQRKRNSGVRQWTELNNIKTWPQMSAPLESNPIVKAEWENLAKTYVRLAKQAGDDTRTTGPTYDPIRDMLERARS